MRCGGKSRRPGSPSACWRASTPNGRRRPWWAAAIAAAVLLAAGVEFEHQRRLRAEGEQAKERVMLALHITGSKLQFVKEKINALDSTRH